MFRHYLSLAAPGYLVLLAIVPILWWLSFRRLADLGRVRRVAVLLVRNGLIALWVLTLAEIELVRLDDRLTVFYLVDQSASIPPRERRAMVDYVNADVAQHRRGEDRFGVIVFGRDAAIEIPPTERAVSLSPVIESKVDPQRTNLAAALRLAQATFPAETTKRVVLLSDGNQNRGDAIEQAQSLAAAATSIDVAAVGPASRNEVAVERLIAPAEVRRGEPFDLRVVLSNRGEPREVRGRLILSQTNSDPPRVLSDQRITLPLGKRVFTVRQKIEAASFVSYEARFIVDRSEDDGMPQNNRATAFSQVVGSGHVLIVEASENHGEHDLLAERLRQQGLEVTLRATTQLFATLADLQPFDTVVLADVPRAGREGAAFSDAQIDILVRNTQQLGAGLVMLGGPNSFGAGGWTGTALEKAMPVDFQVKDNLATPGGALVMVLDKSGSMSGAKIALSKAAAIEAARMLGPQDYVGVVAFDVATTWVVPLEHASNLPAFVERLENLAGSGGTDLSPAMKAGYEALRKNDAALKHMIVLTDGRTTGGGFAELAARMRSEHITVSSVAVGSDADRELMQAIARAGGGQSYAVDSPESIPRIFQHEARRVARSLIFEDQPAWQPELNPLPELLTGIDSLPPITGLVLTSRKPTPLAEVVATSPRPARDEKSPLLAAWTYGLGRAVVFTSDAGTRWTRDWIDQPAYDKVFGQVIRWSMRSREDDGRFQVSFESQDDRMGVTLTARDAHDSRSDLLPLGGVVMGPESSEPIPLTMESIAPGRYRGTFATREVGNYFITLSPGRGKGVVRRGVNVPYSDEFRDCGTNEPLLRQLAAIAPAGTPPGHWIGSLGHSATESLSDSFRHDLPPVASRQPAWHWSLIAACCLLVIDIFLRRTQFGSAWRQTDVLESVAHGPEKPTPVQSDTMTRLRSRKAEVMQELESRRR